MNNLFILLTFVSINLSLTFYSPIWRGIIKRLKTNVDCKIIDLLSKKLNEKENKDMFFKFLREKEIILNINSIKLFIKKNLKKYRDLDIYRDEILTKIKDLLF